jgi:alcohol dehydrogenase
MKAMVIRQHGGIEQIRYEENYPDPAPGPGEVVVAVGATSLNYHDLFTLKGMPGIKVPMPMIMGIDVAGTIASVGPGVAEWKSGDRVLIDPINREQYRIIGEMYEGGLAQMLKVPTHQLIKLPASISFEDAAALPVAYGTAYRMMVARGGVKKGERVLILGASGGVGTCCVQLAKMVGAEVVACASSEDKLQRLRKIGADHTINYVETDFMDEVHRRFGKPRANGDSNGVGVVINFTGGDTWVKSLRCLQRYGRMLTCGATAGYDPKTDIRFIWTYELSIVGSNGWERQDLIDLLRLTESRKITPVIDHVFPLAETRSAFAKLEKRDVCGKVLVKP